MYVYLLYCSYLNQAVAKKKPSASAGKVARAKGKSKKSVRFEVDEEYVEDAAVEDDAGQDNSDSDDDFDMSKVSLPSICIRTSLFMNCTLPVVLYLYLSC